MVQLIGLKYGTVPIGRAVGGLADTVVDRDFGSCPPEHRNGHVFNDPDYAGIESALRRAFGIWNHYPRDFRNLMGNGMCSDYS